MRACFMWGVISLAFLPSVTSGAAVYFVGASEDNGAGGADFSAWPDDGLVMEHLQDQGHEVFYSSGNNSTTQFAEAFDLVVISSTLGSGSARGKFHTIATPILQWEEALLHVQEGNFAITESGDDANNGTDARALEINITNPDHPLAAGFDGIVEIADDPDLIAMPWAANVVEGVSVIAEHVELPDRKVLTAVEVGTELADGRVSPMKMVNFPIQDRDFGLLNENGLLLFDVAVAWLLSDGPLGPICDFDGSGSCDISDLDELLDNLGSDDSTYDLDNSGGNITLDDRDAWLAEASSLSNPTREYRPGDTDLDGDVDAGDLNNLGVAWQSTDNPGWADGDFNGDDTVNANDLNDLAVNWLHGTTPAAAVPEPKASLVFMAVFAAIVARRKLG